METIIHCMHSQNIVDVLFDAEQEDPGNKSPSIILLNVVGLYNVGKKRILSHELCSLMSH